MTLVLAIQQASSAKSIPDEKQLERWLNAAIQKGYENHELCLRLVDEAEITELNHQYRQKNKATNVLSFPANLPDGINLPLLGDMVICAPIVEQEAKEQGKSNDAHWAHMCVHGMLHLQGFDHINDHDAEIMEALETTILQSIGFSSPYILEGTQ